MRRNIFCNAINGIEKTRFTLSADKMYDTNAVQQTLEDHFSNAEIVIPPKDNTFANEAHQSKRMICSLRLWHYRGAVRVVIDIKY
ncbi:hypothetical protein PLEI_0258 [Photobacterium leiognathi lrivu.4.1]|uniref:Transposase n=1 Tax=Photobacterium leiognathi lrivu.4.1 TaxID=1248232 RepID=V5H1K9_PHOLE|nr:hypothetical protein PLEI_0258 [Photobacterium leiognathi lrivu.4.1]